MRRPSNFIVCIASVFVGIAACADSLRLNNGIRIVGVVEELQENHIVIGTSIETAYPIGNITQLYLSILRPELSEQILIICLERGNILLARHIIQSRQLNSDMRVKTIRVDVKWVNGWKVYDKAMNNYKTAKRRCKAARKMYKNLQLAKAITEERIDKLGDRLTRVNRIRRTNIRGRLIDLRRECREAGEAVDRAVDKAAEAKVICAGVETELQAVCHDLWKEYFARRK